MGTPVNVDPSKPVNQIINAGGGSTRVITKQVPPNPDAVVAPAPEVFVPAVIDDEDDGYITPYDSDEDVLDGDLDSDSDDGE